MPLAIEQRENPKPLNINHVCVIFRCFNATSYGPHLIFDLNFFEISFCFEKQQTFPSVVMDETFTFVFIFHLTGSLQQYLKTWPSDLGVLIESQVYLSQIKSKFLKCKSNLNPFESNPQVRFKQIRIKPRVVFVHHCSRLPSVATENLPDSNCWSSCMLLTAS
jgi:hypothetical protein